MNYLAHLYLADGSPDSLIGNLLGDFVSGDCRKRYGSKIWRGILMHREIDKFTDRHPIFLRSRTRIHREFGLFRGVMVDVFYDHFLAMEWRDYSPVPLETFSQKVYEVLLKREQILPPRLREVLPRMVSQNWLVSYRKKESMASVLKGLGRRFSRENNLGEGYRELERNYDDLATDFRAFFPELIEYTDGIRFEEDPWKGI